ncbi:MAG: shikimate dehydrogenase [Amphiplicatus sp.]
MSDPAARPRLAAVIGWPIGHSLSPAIHRFWAEREGANAYYVPLAVEPSYEAFARACDALAALGFAGCNVTLPHKEHALAYAARASRRAAAAGAANMLTFDPAGAEADNSDIPGFAEALREALGETAPGGKAVVLGAGGAARAVVLALAEAGYRPILVANRSPEKAAQVARLAAAGETVPWAARSDALAGAKVLVNATSLGMTGAPPLDIALDALPDDAVVADLVYAPLKTDLLRRARGRGLAVADGLSMLMHQAAFGYRAWLGKQAAADGALRAALEEALARRERS